MVAWCEYRLLAELAVTAVTAMTAMTAVTAVTALLWWKGRSLL